MDEETLNEDSGNCVIKTDANKTWSFSISHRLFERKMLTRDQREKNYELEINTTTVSGSKNYGVRVKLREQPEHSLMMVNIFFGKPVKYVW